MKRRQRTGRLITAIIVLIISVVALIVQPEVHRSAAPSDTSEGIVNSPALIALEKLAVKGRAPKTGYERALFGDGWASTLGCDTRDIILNRDMTNVKIDGECEVLSGTLIDPYTGKVIQFQRGETTSDDVQIDHVVALSDAWQTGAQQLTPARREALSNDPLELLAVDGDANQEKSDANAASWLPPNLSFRCQYTARQIAVKLKYELWVIPAEKEAMQQILSSCPDQPVPTARTALQLLP